MTDFLTRQNFMLLVLVLGLVALGYSAWQAQKDEANKFNVFDFFMEDGRVSTVKTTYMVAFGMTTWLLVDLELKGKMESGYLATYCMAWVTPLVARVVFKQSTMPVQEQKDDTQ